MNIEKLTEREFKKYGCREKHDRIARIVAETFYTMGWDVDTEVDYKFEREGRVWLRGDFDVRATKGMYQSLVEVKSTDCERSINKAVNQLSRARAYSEIVYPHLRTFTFYASENQDTGDVLLARFYDYETNSHYQSVVDRFT